MVACLIEWHLTDKTVERLQFLDRITFDAGPDGMVTMTNVNLSYEMVDLITASRAYEANLSYAKNARLLAMKTLEIGK